MSVLSETALRVSHYQPNGDMKPHSHSESSLILVLHGEYRERIRHTDTLHGPGDLLFYPAHARHSQTFGQSGTRKIVFRPTPQWEKFLSERVPSLQDAPSTSSAEVRFLGARLFQELQHSDDCSELACEGLMCEIVATFGRKANEYTVSRPALWLANVRDCLYDGFQESHTLDQLAAIGGHHPIHLAREFRRCYGESIGQFVRKRRVETAARFLTTTSLEIADIALRSGFSSQSHLCRVFKKHYGDSPARFRQQSGPVRSGALSML